MKFSKNFIMASQGEIQPLWIETEEDIAKADIKWSVEGDAVALQSFAGDGQWDINHGVLVIFNKEGNATVTAEYNGQVFTCQAVTTAKCTLKDGDAIHFYIGDMHDHTTNIHYADQFAVREGEGPEEYVDFIQQENKIDFSVISDHGGILNNKDFFRGFVANEKADYGDAIIFPGSESEITLRELDRFGHVHKNSGELVVINAANYINGSVWQQFIDAFESSPEPIGVYAHPQVMGSPFSRMPGIWNFKYAENNTPEMLRIMRGIEIGNGGDRSENLLHEYCYSCALDNGFRVSTTCGSDAHGQQGWGYSIMPGKTIIMAPKKTRGYFIDAFRNNRFYACESGNIKLKYYVNGNLAPCDLPEATNYVFKVEIDYFNEDPTTVPVKCQVISDGGNIIETIENVDFSDFTFMVRSKTARYFFLRFFDSQGRKTWSPPVWTGREFDKAKKLDLTPIDSTGFTAFDEVGKTDASVAINNDAHDSWFSTQSTASVVIDMKCEQEISAVGHFPHHINRAEEKGPHWKPSIELCMLPSQFEVLTSLDGVEYTLQYKGTVQTFGGENIIDFDTTKARYVKFNVLSNVGTESGRKNYYNKIVAIGNLTIFK